MGAAVAGGIIQGVLGMKAAKAQSSAAQSAADAQSQAAYAGIAAQKEMQQNAFDFYREQVGEAREMFSPYSRQGLRAAAAFEFLRTGRKPTSQDLRDITGLTGYERQLEAEQDKERSLQQKAKELEAMISGRQYSGAYGLKDLQMQLENVQEELGTIDYSGLQESITQAQAQVDAGWEAPDIQESAFYQNQLEAQNRALERRYRASGVVGSSHAAEISSREAGRLSAEEQERIKADLLNMVNTGVGGMAQIGQAGGAAASGVGMITSYGQGLPGQFLGQAGQGQAQAALVSGGVKAGVYGNLSNLVGDLVQGQMIPKAGQTVAPAAGGVQPGVNVNALYGNLVPGVPFAGNYLNTGV